MVNSLVHSDEAIYYAIKRRLACFAYSFFYFRFFVYSRTLALTHATAHTPLLCWSRIYLLYTSTVKCHTSAKCTRHTFVRYSANHSYNCTCGLCTWPRARALSIDIAHRSTCERVRIYLFFTIETIVSRLDWGSWYSKHIYIARAEHVKLQIITYHMRVVLSTPSTTNRSSNNYFIDFAALAKLAVIGVWWARCLYSVWRDAACCFVFVDPSLP